jgi:HEPN domain-containing protein
MNRIDFQEIAELRLRESKALLAAGIPEGAYYLAGYAVECALKACIAKRTQEHDFPDKDSRKWFIHDLEDLLGFARLKIELDSAMKLNPALKTNWTIVRNWSEESRYEKKKSVQEATDLLKAIENQQAELLPWVRLHW